MNNCASLIRPLHLPILRLIATMLSTSPPTGAIGHNGRSEANSKQKTRLEDVQGETRKLEETSGNSYETVGT